MKMYKKEGSDFYENKNNSRHYGCPVIFTDVVQ